MKGFSAYKALNDWKPWQLLKTVNASSYNPNVQGLEITIGSPINNEESKLKIRGIIYIDWDIYIDIGITDYILCI